MANSKGTFDLLGYHVSISVTKLDNDRWNCTYIIKCVTHVTEIVCSNEQQAIDVAARAARNTIYSLQDSDWVGTTCNARL